MIGLAKVRETVDSAAAKLQETTGALALLGVAALAVALVALVIAVKGRTA